MKKILLGVSLLCVLSIASSAQTYYQVQPHTCMLATYNCNGIPLDKHAAYSFGGGYTGIVVGGYFALAVNSTTESGSITHILHQAPPLRKGDHGPFEFVFSLRNGHMGMVSGQITVMQVCHPHCYPYAIVESSTVVIK
jgi:hypothetical protein